MFNNSNYKVNSMVEDDIDNQRNEILNLEHNNFTLMPFGLTGDSLVNFNEPKYAIFERDLKEDQTTFPIFSGNLGEHKIVQRFGFELVGSLDLTINDDSYDLNLYSLH